MKNPESRVKLKIKTKMESITFDFTNGLKIIKN